jgi:A/G-specific adenine glycosylase
VACVDGNVVRILARLTADGHTHRDSASAAKAFAPLAQALLHARRPGDHNQAMMELGATVCTRQRPLCLTCPVRAFCAAAAAGEPELYPRFEPKRIEQRAVTRVWCTRGDALLLHRSAASAKRFANMHELPLGEHIGFEPSQRPDVPPLATKRRAITRFQIEVNGPLHGGNPGKRMIEPSSARISMSYSLPVARQGTLIVPKPCIFGS